MAIFLKPNFIILVILKSWQQSNGIIEQDYNVDTCRSGLVVFLSARFIKNLRNIHAT